MTDLSEFTIIERYFSRHAGLQVAASPVHYAGGDDAAVLAPIPPECVDVVSVDQQVAGQHFYPQADAYDLGHKAVAVALSDIAAMAAIPHSVLLSLTLPQADAAWLQAFSDGMYQLLEQHAVRLIGGNISAGCELNISITAWGRVAAEQVAYRHAAQVGDHIYCIGWLGLAALGRACYTSKLQLPAVLQEQALSAWLRPQARCDAVPAVAGNVNAAIDVSDGLLADVQHILAASQQASGKALGADLFFAKIELPENLGAELGARLAPDAIAQLILQGGEDYALCVTVPPDKKPLFLAAMKHAQRQVSSLMAIPVMEVGMVTANDELRVLDSKGQLLDFKQGGWRHF